MKSLNGRMTDSRKLLQVKLAEQRVSRLFLSFGVNGVDNTPKNAVLADFGRSYRKQKQRLVHLQLTAG